MESTQRLEFSNDDDDDNVEPSQEFEKKVFGKFVFLICEDNDREQTFQIFGGENRIGRDPEQSSIVLNSKSLSRVHAVIEVSRDGSVLLYDDHSMNGTYRNSKKLKPGVRYNLDGGEDLILGDIKAKFLAIEKNPETPEKTGDDSNFFVPETPSTLPRSHIKQFLPEASSSPFPTTTRLAVNLANDDSANDTSSFIAPSQPVSTFSRTVVPSQLQMEEDVTLTCETESPKPTDLMLMETQKFDETESPKPTDLMLMETQKFDETESPKPTDLMLMETQKFDETESPKPTDLMLMETQKFDETSKIMPMETQVSNDVFEVPNIQSELETGLKLVEFKQPDQVEEQMEPDIGLKLIKLKQLGQVEEQMEVEEELCVAKTHFKCGQKDKNQLAEMDHKNETEVQTIQKTSNPTREISDQNDQVKNQEAETHKDDESKADVTQTNVQQDEAQNILDSKPADKTKCDEKINDEAETQLFCDDREMEQSMADVTQTNAQPDETATAQNDLDSKPADKTKCDEKINDEAETQLFCDDREMEQSMADVTQTNAPPDETATAQNDADSKSEDEKLIAEAETQLLNETNDDKFFESEDQIFLGEDKPVNIHNADTQIEDEKSAESEEKQGNDLTSPLKANDKDETCSNASESLLDLFSQETNDDITTNNNVTNDDNNDITTNNDDITNDDNHDITANTDVTNDVTTNDDDVTNDETKILESETDATNNESTILESEEAKKEKISSAKSEEDLFDDEYEEDYLGATQLIDHNQIETQNSNMQDHDASSSDDDDDFIASSQLTGPDRTNFTCRTMSLTTIKESTIHVHQHVTRINESENDFSEGEEESIPTPDKIPGSPLPSVPGNVEATDSTGQDVSDEIVDYPACGDVNGKTSKDASSKTGDGVDGKTSDGVDGKTCDDGDSIKTPNNVHDTTSDDVNGKTSDDVNGKTSDDVNGKRSDDGDDFSTPTTDDPKVHDITSTPIVDTDKIVPRSKGLSSKLLLDDADDDQLASTQMLMGSEGMSTSPILDTVADLETEETKPEVDHDTNNVRRSGRTTRPSMRLGGSDFVSDPFEDDQVPTTSKRSIATDTTTSRRSTSRKSPRKTSDSDLGGTIKDEAPKDPSANTDPPLASTTGRRDKKMTKPDTKSDLDILPDLEPTTVSHQKSKSPSSSKRLQQSTTPDQQTPDSSPAARGRRKSKQSVIASEFSDKVLENVEMDELPDQKEVNNKPQTPTKRVQQSIIPDQQIPDSSPARGRRKSKPSLIASESSDKVVEILEPDEAQEDSIEEKISPKKRGRKLKTESRSARNVSIGRETSENTSTEENDSKVAQPDESVVEIETSKSNADTNESSLVSVKSKVDTNESSLVSAKSSRKTKASDDIPVTTNSPSKRGRKSLAATAHGTEIELPSSPSKQKNQIIDRETKSPVKHGKMSDSKTSNERTLAHVSTSDQQVTVVEENNPKDFSVVEPEPSKLSRRRKQPQAVEEEDKPSVDDSKPIGRGQRKVDTSVKEQSKSPVKKTKQHDSVEQITEDPEMTGASPKRGRQKQAEPSKPSGRGRKHPTQTLEPNIEESTVVPEPPKHGEKATELIEQMTEEPEMTGASPKRGQKKQAESSKPSGRGRKQPTQKPEPAIEESPKLGGRRGRKAAQAQRMEIESTLEEVLKAYEPTLADVSKADESTLADVSKADESTLADVSKADESFGDQSTVAGKSLPAGRRGRPSAQKCETELPNVTQTSRQQTDQIERGRKGRQPNKNIATKSLNEDSNIVEPPSKRGRQAAKNLKNTSVTEDAAVVDPSRHSASVIEDTTAIEPTKPGVGRGRQSTKNLVKESVVDEPEQATTVDPSKPLPRRGRQSVRDDSVDSNTAPVIEPNKPAVGRGRQSTKNMKSGSVVEVAEVEPSKPSPRRGRQSAKADSTIEDSNTAPAIEPSKPVVRRGRQSVKNDSVIEDSTKTDAIEPPAMGRGRQSARNLINKSVVEEPEQVTTVDPSKPPPRRGRQSLRDDSADSNTAPVIEPSKPAVGRGRRSTKKQMGESAVEVADTLTVAEPSVTRHHSTKNGSDIKPPEPLKREPASRKGLTRKTPEPEQTSELLSESLMDQTSNSESEMAPLGKRAQKRKEELEPKNNKKEIQGASQSEQSSPAKRGRGARSGLAEPPKVEPVSFGRKRKTEPILSNIEEEPSPEKISKQDVSESKNEQLRGSKKSDDSLSVVVETSARGGRRKTSKPVKSDEQVELEVESSRRGGKRNAAKPEPDEPVVSQRKTSKADEQVELEAETSGRGRRKTSKPAVEDEPVEPDETVALEAKTSGRGGRQRKAAKPVEEDAPVDPEAEMSRRGRAAKKSKVGVAKDSTANKELEKVKMESSSSLDSASHHQSPSRVKPKPTVMFTGYESKQHEKIVKDLGGFLTSNPSDCTVLVTDKIRRTVKFLCIMGKGIPIVSQQWLNSSKEAKLFLDPWKYVLEDIESEKKWGFRLKMSLNSASNDPLLKGYSVYATKKCIPPPNEMKEMVECAGGSWLKTAPRKSCENVFAISCSEDKSEKEKLESYGIRVLDKEILLTGLLRHQLDFKAHAL